MEELACLPGGPPSFPLMAPTGCASVRDRQTERVQTSMMLLPLTSVTAVPPLPNSPIHLFKKTSSGRAAPSRARSRIRQGQAVPSLRWLLALLLLM